MAKTADENMGKNYAAGPEEGIRSIGIIMMAAGEGSRFGSNKLLAQIQGKKLFTYCVDAVSGITLTEKDGVNISRLIVTGYGEVKEYAAKRNIRAVENLEPKLGISHTIQLGLKEFSDMDAVIFTVCDQPGVTNATYERLIKAYINGQKGLAALAEGGEILGNPCLFTKKYYGELFMLEGDVGGKRVIKKHPDDLLSVQAQEGELKDIDYKEDCRACLGPINDILK